jgi:hypothetical protein
MDQFDLAWKMLPFLLLLVYGAYTILEIFFPSLRSSDFNRWEIDEGSGSSIQIMGWKKVLSPPRVLASGYLSERAACTVALCLGTVFVAIGVLGIRHVSGIPLWFPDLFGRFSH